MPVAGHSTILNAKLVRTISGTNVTIQVLAGSNVSVAENIPPGLTPTNILGGIFNFYSNGQITWFTPTTPAVFTYTVFGEPGTYTLSGSTSAEPIFGDSVVVILDTEIEVPPPDILAFAPAAPGPLHADLHLGGRPGLRGADQRRARRHQRLGRLRRAGCRRGRRDARSGPVRAAASFLPRQSSGP
jgi:hypothetical protein